MKTFLVSLGVIVTGVLLVLVVIFGFAFVGQAYNINHVDNVPIVAYVDGVKVYEGISAGIKLDKTAGTTKIIVYGGFLYLFPQAYYVSDNVKVEGKK